MRINFDKIDGFFRVLDGEIENLAFFDYRLFDEICNRMHVLWVKKVVLQIVLISILEKSEFIDIVVLYLLKKYLSFLILYYILNQLLVRIKMNITRIYF